MFRYLKMFKNVVRLIFIWVWILNNMCYDLKMLRVFCGILYILGKVDYYEKLIYF